MAGSRPDGGSPPRRRRDVGRGWSLTRTLLYGVAVLLLLVAELICPAGLGTTGRPAGSAPVAADVTADVAAPVMTEVAAEMTAEVTARPGSRTPGAARTDQPAARAPHAVSRGGLRLLALAAVLVTLTPILPSPPWSSARRRRVRLSPGWASPRQTRAPPFCAA